MAKKPIYPETHEVEVRKCDDGLYWVFVDGEQAEGLNATNAVLAKFLADWAREALNACQKKAAELGN